MEKRNTQGYASNHGKRIIMEVRVIIKMPSYQVNEEIITELSN
jgi:hypothetical protein